MISKSIGPAFIPALERKSPWSGEAVPLQVEEVVSDSALAGLKEEWERLQTEAAVPNPFLTWGWSSAWWRHFGAGKRLELLVLRDREKMVGLAPFYREEIRPAGIPLDRLRFLGDEGVGSDHLDLIAQQGREEEVARSVAAWWLRRPRRWDRIYLKGMAEESGALSALMEALGPRWTLQAEGREVCPFLPLPQTWDDYLATRSGSMRYTIRRKIRSLEKEHQVEFRVIEETEEGLPGMDLLLDLHKKRWDAEGGSDAFVAPSKIQFHREAAEYFFKKGMAKLFFLEVDRKPIAALYGILFGKKFFYYQAGFDPSCGNQSVGMVLMAKSVEAAIRYGLGEFDFLRGPEAYKAHWTSSERRILDLSIYPPGLKSGLYRHAVRLGREIKERIKPLLPVSWISRIRAWRDR